MCLVVYVLLRSPEAGFKRRLMGVFEHPEPPGTPLQCEYIIYMHVLSHLGKSHSNEAYKKYLTESSALAAG